MPSTVITYVNPLELDHHPLLPNLPDLPQMVQICATPSLKAGMVKYYRPSHPYMGTRTIEARKLFEKLLRPWMNDAVRIRQHARLTRLLEDLKRTGPLEWGNQLRAFRRNQRDVLLAMRVLTEANVQPSDLRPGTVDEQIFQRLWAEMERQDPAMGTVRRLLFTELTQPDVFRRRLYDALFEAICESNTMRKPPLPLPTPEELQVERLLLHGYYFLTPLQKRFVELAENAGLELIFLNCYDPRYPTVHRTWEAFFDRTNGLPGKDEWQLPSATPGGVACEPTRLVLGELFEGRQPSVTGSMTGPISIRRYENFGAFLQQFAADHPLDEEGKAKRNPLSPLYLSPEAEEISRFLKEYYPARDGEQNRHFLAYPIGQLLFHIHRMWDEEEADPDRRLKISARPLFECFASGWLQTGGLNGRDYLRDLEDMLPFFQGCETLQEWRERALLLAAIRTGVVARFDSNLGHDNPNRRFHQLLGNPLERLAHFRVKAESVTAVVALMDQLFHIAGQLFDHGEVALAEHMERIETLLLLGVDKSELLTEERKLLEDLSRRLRDDPGTGEKFLPQDLAMAIAFYLGGDLNPDDGDQDQEELDPDHLVARLDRLDGAVLAEHDRPLHLCILGETSLPKRKGAFPWPLTARTFDHMQSHWAVRMLALREQESANADRYLLHYALAWADEVTLSWIVHWQEHRLGPSPYLVLLEPFVPSNDTAVQPWGAGLTAPSRPEPAWDRAVRPDSYERLPTDAVAEYALCPRRFFYSFLAQESPSFRSDFHHQFLFGSLARAFVRTAGESVEKVLEEMEPLFPQWSGLLRQDLIERTPFPKDDFDRYDHVEYPRARFALQFAMLRRDEMGKAVAVLEEPAAERQALEQMTRSVANAEALMPPDPAVACRYCPHMGRCDAAQYPIDDE